MKIHRTQYIYVCTGLMFIGLLAICTKICFDVASGMTPSWVLFKLSIMVVLLFFAGLLMVPREEDIYVLEEMREEEEK